MILPGDGDDPAGTNGKRPDHDGPAGGYGGADDPDEFDDDDDEEGDGIQYSPSVQKTAGPGWRADLRRELDACVDDLREIEDPDEDFDPPEPPDLYTFYGELAALRNEVRRAGRRSAGAVERLGEALRIARQEGADDPADDAKEAIAWPTDLCLSLVALYDLVADSCPGAALEASFQSLAREAGLERIPTTGRPFDPSRMTVTGVEVAAGSPPNSVIRETEAGFLRAGVLLRPARVIVSG